MSATQLTFEEQLAIDMELHRLAHATLYELLGVSASADAVAVQRAWRERTERLRPESYGDRELGDYLPRIEQLLHALDDARTTLTDPTRRVRYDESLLVRPPTLNSSPDDAWTFEDSVPPSAPSSPPPAPTALRPPPATPERQVAIARVQLSQVASSPATPPNIARAPRQPPPAPPPPRLAVTPGVRPSSIPPAPRPGVAPGALNGVPRNHARVMEVTDAPERLASPEETARSQRTHFATPAPLAPSLSSAPPPVPLLSSLPPSPPSVAPGPFPSLAPAAIASVAPAPLPAVMPPPPDDRWVSRDDYNALQADMGALLQELNVVCRAVEFCLAVAEPGDSPRRTAVASSRGAIAALRARRAEREQEWAFALENWERAILANPMEARYHAHLADVLVRMEGDLEIAENHARRAVELNPDLAYAQSTLAVVLSRREF